MEEDGEEDSDSASGRLMKKVWVVSQTKMEWMDATEYGARTQTTLVGFSRRLPHGTTTFCLVSVADSQTRSSQMDAGIFARRGMRNRKRRSERSRMLSLVLCELIRWLRKSDEKLVG